VADLVLAGGVEAPLSLTGVLSFHRTGVLSRATQADEACRPFDRDRSGFFLGEGAGFVVLRRAEDVPADDVLGHVLGYAATCDAAHLVAPREDGAIAARCMDMAIRAAGLTRAQIGHINAHGAGTVHSDRAEARAVDAVFGGDPPPATAVKGVTGHMIGGSAAVEAIVSLLTLRHGLLPPTAGLRNRDAGVTFNVVAGSPRPVPRTYGISNAFAFGGNNTALVLAATTTTDQR
jgi:3-oxoacyl-[acyl-carrier-protein] synthase II